MVSQLLWRSCSTQHNWTDGAFLVRLLEQATTLGLIGKLTWYKAGHDGERIAVGPTDPSKLVDMLPTPMAGDLPAAYLEAGADDTHPWEVALSVAQVDPESGSPLMPNMASIFFHAPESSHALGEAFCQLHQPTDTEYAFIHDYEHWKHMGGSAYRRPVTIGPMFQGVYWANFLGPGHIDHFDRTQLKELPAVRTDWGADSVCVVATETWSEAVTPAGEALLLSLTERFRAAMKPTSPWR